MTSIIGHSERPRRRGFTLVEVMITLTLTVMIISGLTSSYMFMIKSSVSVGNYADMNSQSRIGLEKFGRDVRMASAVYTMTSSLLDIDVSTTTVTKRVIYQYDSGNKQFLQIVGSTTIPILKYLESFSISYYKHNGATATIPVEVKMIQVEAEMVRKSLEREDTNHVISSQYMIRIK